MTTVKDFIQYNPDGSMTRHITPLPVARFCDFRARLGGRFIIEVKDKSGNVISHQECDNLIVNNGIKALGDILIGSKTTNLDLGFIEPDAGSTCITICDTDIETPVDACDLDRLTASAQTRDVCSPFAVTISGFIGTCKWTRPFTINKLSVFFGPDECGCMFAAGKLSCPVTVTGCNSATITYGIFFR